MLLKSESLFTDSVCFVRAQHEPAFELRSFSTCKSKGNKFRLHNTKQASIRFVEGLGGVNTPHWLKMTPTLVVANFCLGVGFDQPSPPTPDPARPT